MTNRELDALVAEKVMGWKRTSEQMPWIGDDASVHWLDDVRFTQDMRAAWLIVEKAGTLDGERVLHRDMNADEAKRWQVGVVGQGGWEETVSMAPTPMEAICFAALRDVGITEA